jgi:hypothetical protein
MRIGGEGEVLEIRRVTLVLAQPTGDGETELHLLTNLPAKDAGALIVVELYRKRWRIENAFQELGQAFEGEINTLCYPGAALLAFCIALYTYNAVSGVKAALHHIYKDKAPPDRISVYYLGAEISATYGGMMIAIPPGAWTKTFGNLTPAKMASILKYLARSVPIERFMKTTRGPKNPPPERSSAKSAPHVSTKRLLDQRRAKSATQ